MPTETKGARRAAMERTEYILCVAVVERSLELLAEVEVIGRREIPQLAMQMGLKMLLKSSLVGVIIRGGKDTTSSTS